jgi:hypothetical protein
VHGGWGKGGATHIRLAAASEDTLAGALHTAWKLRVENNEKSVKKTRTATKSSAIRPARQKPRSTKSS